MEDFRFYEGKLPSAYRYNFELSLFHSEDYRLLQSSTGWVSFYILNERDFLVEAQIHFHVKNDVARSSIQSPFGGVEVSNKVSKKTLLNFIDFFSNRLRDMNCTTMIIVNHPQAYDREQQAVIETFLLNTGFAVSTAELGSVIHVSQKSFDELLHPRKKRKLNQPANEQLAFEILPAEKLQEIYNFIESHRKQKEYTLSISFDHLKQSVGKLQGAYLMFGVYHDSKLVAASVAVRISKNILYHFISDHVRKIDEARPALVLMRGIYQFCQHNHIELLDLGTSATDGLPNFKLIKFKSELGGESTSKLTFIKKLT